jgi:hypothetical protein
VFCLSSIPVAERTPFVSREFCSLLLPPEALAEVWPWLSSDPPPPPRLAQHQQEHQHQQQQTKRVRCRHCRQTVVCNSLPEKALAHLKKCQQARVHFDK